MQQAMKEYNALGSRQTGAQSVLNQILRERNVLQLLQGYECNVRSASTRLPESAPGRKDKENGALETGASILECATRKQHELTKQPPEPSPRISSPRVSPFTFQSIQLMVVDAISRSKVLKNIVSRHLSQAHTN